MGEEERHSINAEVVMRVHLATGMPLIACKQYLEQMSAEYTTKLLKAISSRKDSHVSLHDPIEDDPAWSEVIAQVRREAENLAAEEVEKTRRRYRIEGLESCEFLLKRGHCHRVWKFMKKILKERHNVDWYTPAQMNPCNCYD